MHRHTRATTTTTTRPRFGGLFHSRRRTRAAPISTTTTTRRRGLFSGRRHRRTGVVQKRPTTIGDKISGALLRLKGSLTGRPGEKAAGTRRMHGTDGRGMHRRRRFF